MLLRKTDHFILWAVLTPLLSYTAWTKWAVVHSHTPLTGWALLDFLRLHGGYYGLILLWSALLLRAGERPRPWRLTVLVLVSFFVAADFSYSIAIFHTGALAPFDVAYYMGKAVGRLPSSIPATEWLTLAFLPTLFIALAALKWRQLRRSPTSVSLRFNGALAALLLAALLVPPLHPQLELNTARPSYAFQITEFLRQRTVLAEAHAEEPAALPLRLQSAPIQPRNLVIIALESVGAQATGLNNPAMRDVTPFLNELARTSWVAQQAYTVTPHTSKALVAINCGRQPYPRHPIFESTYGLDRPCLAHLLREKGFNTAFFQSPTEHFENRRSLVTNLGFAEFFPGDDMNKNGFQLANYFGYEDNILLQPSDHWIRRQTTPFFAFYLTGTTHHPYWVPDRYGFHEFVKDDPELNRYLNAVHYLDRFTRNLIEQYRQAGLYENTVFVIVGDHGEGLGQHNRLQHNASLYQEVMQVPLLIHAPGLRLQGQGDIASQLDILPSALDLLGFQWQGETDGFALTAPYAQRDAATANCWYDNWCLARADGRYKYIYNFNQKVEEVYDLQADPQERSNIAAQFPELVKQWRAELLARHERELRRWHTHLSQLDEDYWDNRGATLGSSVQLLKLAQDDPRRELLSTQ